MAKWDKRRVSTSPEDDWFNKIADISSLDIAKEHAKRKTIGSHDNIHD
jgi:hypothetical protein